MRNQTPMNTLNKPITNLTEAESYFRELGCSHFHMGRDFPKRYAEYKALNIPKSLEIDWTAAELEALRQQALSPETKSKVLWSIHSHMEQLAQNLNTNESLELVFETTVQLEQRLPPTGKLLVAETINGRSVLPQKSGLIFLAYDLERKDLAKALAEISTRLSESAAKRLRVEHERCLEARTKVNEICEILGL